MSNYQQKELTPEFIANKQYIKEQMEVYLNAKGIDTKRNFRCLAGKHEDRTPSMGFMRDSHAVHCFSCNSTMDIFDLIGVEFGLTKNSDKMKKAFEMFGLPFDPYGNGATQYQKQSGIEQKTPQAFTPPPLPVVSKKHEQEPQKDLTSYIAECAKRAHLTDYFAFRGLTAETVKRFNLGYIIERDMFWDEDKTIRFADMEAIVIPVDKYHVIKRNVDKNASKLNRFRKKGKDFPPFNLSAIDNAKERAVFIVESEIDAMTIEQLGFPAIGLGGAHAKTSLLEKLKETRPSNPFLIAGDNDDTGREASNKLVDELKSLGLTAKIVTPFGECKDANEAFLSDPDELFNALDDLSREAGSLLETYQAKHGADFILLDFMKEVTERSLPPISTGFNALDKVFDGGLYEGLYIVGAVSSGGKTTLVTQVVESAMKQGRDVLYFSLEMSKFELVAKMLSRITARIAMEKNNVFLGRSNRDLMRAERYKQFTKEQMETINEAKSEFKQYASHLYIVEGVGTVNLENIATMANDHLLLTGNVPLIVVDYLQIISPTDVRATDKQNMDRAVVELKRLARDLKTPVIAISSFNRGSYDKGASMASAKESGAIEYSCDVFVALQSRSVGTSGYDEKTEKRKTPREVELVVLKNRNGRTGDNIEYNYYPQFNLFVEDPEGVNKLDNQ